MKPLSSKEMEYENNMMEMLNKNGELNENIASHFESSLGNRPWLFENTIRELWNIIWNIKLPDVLVQFLNFIWKLLGIDNFYDKLEKTRYIFSYKLTQNHLNKVWDRIKQKFPKSPITSSMIKSSCENRAFLPVEYLLAFMQNDSQFWTAGKWARTHNPWNVWNTDSWATRDFWTWEKWVDACAENLEWRINKYFEASAKHQGKWFNTFPTPIELATWKSKWWVKFSWVYMTDTSWPKRVESIVKTWNGVLVS